MTDIVSRFLDALRQPSAPCNCRNRSCPNYRCDHCMCQATMSSTAYVLDTAGMAPPPSVVAFRFCCKCGQFADNPL